MKRFLLFMTIALTAVSCIKDFRDGRNPAPESESGIPADFNWETTRDLSIAVAAPTVGGVSESANIRVFSSPVLYPENMVVKGVAAAGSQFQTALTLPTGVTKIYVQTTLPNGMTSVQEVAVAATVSVQGAEMTHEKPAADIVVSEKRATRAASSLPDNLKVEKLDKESDFEAGAIIRETPKGELALGYFYNNPANDAPYGKFLIPAGCEVKGNISMNGNGNRYANPILYVAGKLTMSYMSIGKAQLVVLPGGEVEFQNLVAQSFPEKATVYVFEGGKITVGGINLSCENIVNEGKFTVERNTDFNSGRLKFYNTPTGTFKTEALRLSGTSFYNDGIVELEGLKMNSQGAGFYNNEGSELEVDGLCEFENGTTLQQMGRASFDKIIARGTFIVGCYTTVEEMTGSQADIRIAAGACLETEDTEFNNTDVSMAAGAMFIADEYNVEEKGNKNNFSVTSASVDPRPVVIIKEKAYVRQGKSTDFSGPMEVVYDNDKDDDFVIPGRYLSDGAVLRKTQTVVIPGTECNGGKTPVDPGEDPLPSEDYSTQPGTTYSYCFEDNWPWIGDYDLNDVVLVASIDREQSKDGLLVKSITINWKLQAAGTQMKLACAVQMDQVSASDVAEVVSSHRIGSGAFARDGLETGSEKAVIPFFNTTKELLSSSNTFKNNPYVEPVMQTTKITFTQPVDAAKVTESAMNCFITANERPKEVHMPGKTPTVFGDPGKGFSMPNDPYKFYVSKGEHTKNNYMMWALMIPGQFPYPCEGKDIRTVYKAFNAWAASNGSEHTEWYKEETDKELVY